ncbi:MAG TPA: amidohydrolase family protein [Thermomicrobiales bacterium]|jgi:hypothetical protein|nr:amidohydrolase family protein [Thermomicrobiales bacterium]
MVDFATTRVWDVHAHPFLDRGPISPDDFVRLTAFGGGAEEYFEQGGIEPTAEVSAEIQQWKRQTTWHKLLVRELADYFGVERSLDTVVAARNEAVANGYRDYVGKLYESAQIDGIIFDDGYPLPQIPMDKVREQIPVSCKPIYRIEPLIVELLKQDLSWPEFRQKFDDTISNALTSGGYVGVKSVIAYRTGLDISPLSRTPDQGFQALDAVKRGLGGGSMKKLRDHLLCRSLELCTEHGVPMQIHTGMGDFEVNLILARPAYLMDLLRFPAYRACTVILVHTGYPYHREAGYMAHVLPRVYCDISEGVPFAGSGAAAILRELIEMAPLHKISYGSDAYSVPEGIFASAKIGKRVVTRVMTELVADDVLTEAEAQDVGEMILSGTTKRIYNQGG